jgi:hypothetical protein
MGTNHGWRQDIKDGKPMECLSIPINMRIDKWEAVLEALESFEHQSDAMVDAYCQIASNIERVEAAIKSNGLTHIGEENGRQEKAPEPRDMAHYRVTKQRLEL